jgi:hypothetical protein
METQASRLAEYCQSRLGETLRAVGYHTDNTFEVAYIREDLMERYPPETVDQFITSSRGIHNDLQVLDQGMGVAQASLHMLEEGLIVQFHYDGEDVIFLSMDREVGQNFTRFIDDCIDQMSQAGD